VIIDSDLALSATGDPTRALIVLELDDYRDHSAADVARDADTIRRALPLTVGLARSLPDDRLAPLLASCTLTLSPAHPALPRQAVGVEDPDVALDILREAVRRAPRAAVACGQLLRQTEQLDAAAGLAAEAATYSTLLSGAEFARWLAERGPARQQPPPTRPLVRAERDGARLAIVLDHPERRNALSMGLREELLAAMRVAQLDSTVESVQLSGAGPTFCSGGDLDEFGAATDLVAAYLVRLDRAPWRVMDAVARRLTARVHGACIGAGAEMAAFAGTVIAAPDTVFRFPEVFMGLVPGAGGTVSVPRRIGRWRAAWLMVTGQRLAAEAARAWGLVDRVAEREG
jgi:enoyl-CoA hydratase/carnithine racemase